MAIKITGDNLQYGDTAIATLTNTNFTLASGKVLSTDHLTASSLVVNDSAGFHGAITASNGLRVSKGGVYISGGSPGLQVGSSGGDADARFNGDVVLGYDNGNTVSAVARWATDLVPSSDSARDLGTSALQWAEAHIDHGYIDTITATGTSTLTTVDINGGAIDGTTIGASSAVAGTFSDLTVSGHLTASNNIAVTGSIEASGPVHALALSASNLYITDGAYINGAITASSGLYLGMHSDIFSHAGAEFIGDLKTQGDFYVMGATDLGNATSDTITATGRFDSDLVPSTDSARDLGTSALQWAEAHIDHGYIDTITATGTSTLTTVDINGGAIDGTTIGASSAVAGTFSDLTVSGKLTASNGIAVTGESTFSGDVLPGAATNTLGDGSNQWAYLYSKGAEFDDANAMINMPGALVVSKSGNSTTISTKLTASNGISLTNHLAADNGVVTVSGQLTASNGLTVNGNVNFDDAAFSGDVSLGDGRTDVITVNGIATFTEQLTASNGIAVAGDATFAQRTTFSGVTTVSAQLTASNGARIVGDVAIAGTTTITGQLTASQGASITGDVLLGENDTIKAGVYITYSDATLKENIEVISNPIDKVMSMRGVTYNLKSSSGNPEVGFLAQEMKQAVPEVVYGNGDGNLGIDYAKLTSVLVEAIKTQQTQIQEQQSQIDELKDTLLKK